MIGVLTLAARWTVIQAAAHGVTGTKIDGTVHLAERLIDVAPDGWYRIIRPPEHVNATRMLEFARGEVGSEYGYLTILSTAIDIVTPEWFHVPIRKPGTWICSALGAEALRYGGWYCRWPDIYQPTPAAVMHALLATGGVEVELPDAQPGDVGFSHSTGFVPWCIRLAEHGTPDSMVNHMFVLDRHAPTEVRYLHALAA